MSPAQLVGLERGVEAFVEQPIDELAPEADRVSDGQWRRRDGSGLTGWRLEGPLEDDAELRLLVRQLQRHVAELRRAVEAVDLVPRAVEGDAETVFTCLITW